MLVDWLPTQNTQGGLRGRLAAEPRQGLGTPLEVTLCRFPGFLWPSLVTPEDPCPLEGTLGPACCDIRVGQVAEGVGGHGQL